MTDPTQPMTWLLVGPALRQLEHDDQEAIRHALGRCHPMGLVPLTLIERALEVYGADSTLTPDQALALAKRQLAEEAAGG